MKNQHPNFWSTPTGWAALALIAAVTYFLVLEHGQHMLQFLPYLILLPLDARIYAWQSW